MHKARLGVLLGCLWAAGTTRLEAQTIDEHARRALDVYSLDEIASRAQQPPDLPQGGRLGQIYEFETKSPRRAFLYSLVVPGLGQLYAGNRLKAALFFAVDVAAWGGYLTYRSRGRDREDEFRAFADRHWHETPYWDSLKSVRNIDRWRDGENFPHHLPYEVEADGDTVALKNLEYYENIGKYQQFIWGWEDLRRISTAAAAPEDNFASALRDRYVLMREDANKQFDRATTAAIVSIANHLISAFDAALGARRYNQSSQRAQKLDLDLQMVNLDEVPVPWLSVSYRF